MAAPSLLVFQESTGKRRKVELRGAGLPFAGVSWPGNMRVTTTWYPGNGIQATQHVIGPTEGPTTFQGEWNTTRLIRDPVLYSENGQPVQEIARAFSVYELFDTLRRSGSEFEVTWAIDGDRRIRRIGRITSFDPTFDRSDDVRWSLELEWLSRGAAQRPVVIRDDDLIAQSRKLIIAAEKTINSIQNNALRSARSTIRSGSIERIGPRRDKIPTRFNLGKLEALADQAEASLNSFTQVAKNVVGRVKKLGEIIVKVRDLPFGVASQAIDIGANAVAVAAQFQAEITRTPDELWSTTGKRSTIALLRNAKYFRGSAADAGQMAASAATYLAAARKRRSALLAGTRVGDRAGSSDILAVHIVKQGDTMFTIANKYYKDPGKASVVAKANGLPGYQITVEVGTPLIIPTLTASSSIVNT